MKDYSEQPTSEPDVTGSLHTLMPSLMDHQESVQQQAIRPEKALEIPDQDDRYPGSFFRIPGLPVPGKTTWSLN